MKSMLSTSYGRKLSVHLNNSKSSLTKSPVIKEAAAAYIDIYV